MEASHEVVGLKRKNRKRKQPNMVLQMQMKISIRTFYVSPPSMQNYAVRLFHPKMPQNPNPYTYKYNSTPSSLPPEISLAHTLPFLGPS